MQEIAKLVDQLLLLAGSDYLHLNYRRLWVVLVAAYLASTTNISRNNVSNQEKQTRETDGRAYKPYSQKKTSSTCIEIKPSPNNHDKLKQNEPKPPTLLEVAINSHKRALAISVQKLQRKVTARPPMALELFDLIMSNNMYKLYICKTKRSDTPTYGKKM